MEDGGPEDEKPTRFDEKKPPNKADRCTKTQTSRAEPEPGPNLKKRTPRNRAKKKKKMPTQN